MGIKTRSSSIKTRSSSIAFQMSHLLEKIVEKRNTEGLDKDDIDNVRNLSEFLEHLVEKQQLSNILAKEYERTLNNARKAFEMPF